MASFQRGVNGLFYLCLPLFLLIVISYFAEYTAVIYRDQALASSLVADGPAQTARLLSMLQSGSTHARTFYNYGNLHHFLSFFLAKAYMSLAGSSPTYLLAARMLSIVQWASLFFSLWLGSLILRRFTLPPTAAAAISVLFYLSTPSLFFWSYAIHPDVVQVPLLIAVILFGMSSSETGMALSALFLGLAAGTKYIGGSYLPLVLGAFVIFRVTRGASPSLRPVPRISWLRLPLLMLLAMALGFLVPNWSVLLDPDGFLRDVTAEMRHVAYGHAKAESTDGALWFAILLAQYGVLWLAPLVLPLFLLLRRRLGSRPASPENRRTLLYSWLLVLCAVAVLAHLYLNVNMRRPRYTFHYYPIMLASLGAVYFCLGSFLRRIFLLALICCLACSTVQPFRHSMTRLLKTIDTAQRGEAVRVGRALAASCDPQARFLVPQYSYLPSQFSHRLGGYRFSPQQVQQADVFVLNRAVPGGHVWITPGEREDGLPLTVGRADRSEEQARIFRDVFLGEDVELLYHSDSLLVSQRRSTSACDPDLFRRSLKAEDGLTRRAEHGDPPSTLPPSL